MGEQYYAYKKDGIMIVLKNGNYLTPKDGFASGDIVLHGSEIASVSEHFGVCDKDEIIDLNGCLVIPGLIDIHTHGAMGWDVSTSSAARIVKLSNFYAENGVTSFMPTTITDTDENIRQSLRNIRTASESCELAASIVGAHTEGPYISSIHRGCHPADLICLPKIDTADAIFDILGNSLRWRVTVAPELPGMMKFIKYVIKKGAYVSLGHSDANAETAYKAIGIGANSFTHLFNAMKGIHHREPGIAGAALLCDSFVEIICDGIHVNPDIVKLIYRLKGPEQILLITDSMPATGCKDCSSVFGGINVNVKNGIARTEDGTLAGSTLLLKNAVENITKFTEMSFENAVRTASLNPAKAIGIDAVTGSIEPGKRADLVIMDAEHNILSTYCRGKKVYYRDHR
jgi:N-acetylglucosamine-6-phosphate deacetylase